MHGRTTHPLHRAEQLILQVMSYKYIAKQREKETNHKQHRQRDEILQGIRQTIRMSVFAATRSIARLCRTDHPWRALHHKARATDKSMGILTEPRRISRTASPTDYTALFNSPSGVRLLHLGRRDGNSPSRQSVVFRNPARISNATVGKRLPIALLGCWDASQCMCAKVGGEVHYLRINR